VASWRLIKNVDVSQKLGACPVILTRRGSLPPPRTPSTAWVRREDGFGWTGNHSRTPQKILLRVRFFILSGSMRGAISSPDVMFGQEPALREPVSQARHAPIGILKPQLPERAPMQVSQGYLHRIHLQLAAV